MSYRNPPRPVHIKGTLRGEELARLKGREPGRGGHDARGYRTARDSTGLNPDAHEPIDPRSPNIPPA